LPTMELVVADATVLNAALVATRPFAGEPNPTGARAAMTMTVRKENAAGL
jgi:hypothetical protein